MIAAVGLKREAQLIASDRVATVVGGGEPAGLLAKLHLASAARMPRVVVSVGLAGALSPTLQVGDWVVADRIVADRIVAEGNAWTVDPTLENRLRTMLARLGRSKELYACSRPHPEPVEGQGRSATVGRLVLRQAQDEATSSRGPVELSRVFTGSIAGSDVMITDPKAKAELHAVTGALAVDMESHVAAQFASAKGLPFAALRVISDEAHRALPNAAQAGMKPNGGIDVFAVLKALAKDPRQLPALIRTGREAEVAFQRLKLLGRHDLLGRLGIGELDLGELGLDVT